jgi:hypothetical protein
VPLQLKTHGPIEIPTERLPGGRTIPPTAVADLWSRHRSLAEARGCYVFAMRAGSGIVPGYVGKACRSFEQECFTPDKIGKYLQFAAHYARGTPVMFLVVAPSTRGRPNERAIGECERQLIQLACRVSDRLINVQGTSGPSFIVPHITGGVRGRPSQATLALLRALCLDEPVERSQTAAAETTGTAVLEMQ